ncbi:hypothetical protein [Paludibaculum fermentans]|uniref:hypothetical protein n=1 Tax=Paludibaculum fermentans TaxID=1473598 RepID=UPI003EBDC0F4
MEQPPSASTPTVTDDQAQHLEKPSAKSPESPVMWGHVRLQVAVAILSFLGATAGVFVSARFEEEKARRDNTYAFKTSILAKRIELIERTARILNKSDAAAHLAQLADLDLKLAKATSELAMVAMAKTGKPGSVNLDEPNYLEKFIATKLQLGEITVEFGTVMVMNKLYFGLKTQQAVDELTQDNKVAWWGEEATARKKRLLTVQFEELPLGLEDRFQTPKR